MENKKKPLQTMPFSWLPPRLRKILKQIIPSRIRLFARKQALTDEKKRLASIQDAFLEIGTCLQEDSHYTQDKKMRRIFGKEDAEITEEQVAYLFSLLQIMRGKEKLETRESIINASYELFSITGWLNLAYLSFRNSLIGLSYYPRLKAIERSYADAKRNIRDAHLQLKACTAAIDEGSYEKTIHFFDLYKSQEEDFSQVLKLEQYINSNFSSRVEHKSDVFFDTAYDETYRSLLENKTVAIVGPANSDTAYGEEIDCYDVVVRPNYLGVEHAPEQKNYGSRTDISFYNSEHCEKIFLSGRSDFFNDLKYIALPYKHYGFQSTLLQQGKARVFERNPFFFNGVPNMIQCILYDIIPFKPSKIKIFNTNFYLSKDLYHSNYTSRHVLQLPVLAEHDLLSQLHYVRNLWKAGAVWIDNEGADVLRLDSKEYMKRMESVHCNANNV